MTLVSTLQRVRLARRPPVARAPTTSALERPSLAPPLAPASQPAEKPRLSDWIGVLAMCTGLVMAIMDVQIVTSSLTQIQGGLSAGSDEIAWVQTAYLIADVVTVPLSGMMSRLLSTRILFVTAALGFTGASAMCATATSLGQMTLYRAVQGCCGPLVR
jgi:MFS transporter, DHA2 family, multidrug resistance protein